jgi:hypothetical protein
MHSVSLRLVSYSTTSSATTPIAPLIGRLHARADAEWLAELLMDLEGEEGEPARLQLAESLRRVLG